MSSSADVSSAVGGAALTFAARGGRTVLVDSHVRAPVALVRPFPLADGGQLVQLITIGPGLCGGDRLRIQIAVETGARVVLTTPAATRVLSMDAGQHSEQRVELAVAAGATLEYYPAITIPFPDSSFRQTINVSARDGARVGVLETWALGRTARDEYLGFRSLSSRATLEVGGELLYADATELNPGRDRLAGAGMLARRRYLASGFWFGITLPEEAPAVDNRDVLVAMAQSTPGVAYLRALASNAPALETTLSGAAARIAAAWEQTPVSLTRFRC
jgi:urease accessory protein